MSPIVVHPDRIRQFGATDGCTFCLVTNPDLRSHFAVEPSGDYCAHRIELVEREEDFPLLLQQLPEPCHVLVASPGCFFQSPPPELIGRRKLIAMACNSTPTDLRSIAHFLEIIERTDPDVLQDFSERFFGLAEASEWLEIVDEEHGTCARFEHFRQELEWNQQAGPLAWGEQQIAPMGEISVLPVFIRSFDADLRLPIDGEICMFGHPILHNGTPSFLRSDQARLHQRLLSMREEPLVATVRGGEIVDLRAGSPAGRDALAALEAMFAVDSRYRIVWEVGFAINTFHRILPGNHAMNEVYGGVNGCLHWGLGLTPFTQYHLDVICPSTRVVGSRGDLLLGNPVAEAAC